MMEFADEVDLPDVCPKCGRECINNNLLKMDERIADHFDRVRARLDKELSDE